MDENKAGSSGRGYYMKDGAQGMTRPTFLHLLDGFDS